MQEYPKTLLPRENFKSKIDINELELDKDYLIRRSLSGGITETVTVLGSVRSDAFIDYQKEHLFFNLSMNLVGIFNKEHLDFVLTKSDHWEKGITIPPITEIEFNVSPGFCPIYLKLKNIHRISFEYEKGEKKEKFIGTCLIIHKPLTANYWHFELHVLDHEGVLIPHNGKPWKIKAVANFFESYLKLHLRVEDVDCQINESVYVDKL